MNLKGNKQATNSNTKPEDLLLVERFTQVLLGVLNVFCNYTHSNTSSLSKAGDVGFWDDKRTEADIRHPPQYHLPLARKEKIPSTSDPSHSFLPSFHVKDTHQLILKEVTWASKSLNVTESITGDLSNQTLN